MIFSCRITLITILFFCIAGTASAQLPTPGSNDPNQNPIGTSYIEDTLASGILPLDTPVAMKYVLLSAPQKVISFTDTFDWDDTRHFPLAFHYAHLGNYGSATRSLSPAIILKTGFSTGWDQYDPYYVHVDSFRYYHQDVPVARIKYSQSNQNDTYVALDFGRNFAKGFNLSFTYDRLNQQGKFAHQNQRNTALGIGVWHDAPSGKYDAFYNFISNGAEAEENGGIINTNLIGSFFPRDLEFVPVNIQSGNTTHKHRIFTTKQILHLVSDTTQLGVDVWLQAHYVTSLYKYVDNDVLNDTNTLDYYGLAFVPDTRGIRQFTFQKEYQIAGGISLPWHAANSTLSTSLRLRNINLFQEPDSRIINELFWDASGNFNFIDAVELNGFMSFGLGQAAGSFLFKAHANLKTGILGNFEGFWSIVTRKPHMIEERLFVNQQLIYNVELQNPFTTEFGVMWNWGQQNLRAGITWSVFDNFIFFNAFRMPEQLDGSFSLRRYFAHKDFDFKWIGITGDVVWQPDTKDELAIPELIYSAGLYGRIKIFKKKVTLMPGVDIFHHDGFTAVSYFPVTGRYYLSGEQNMPDYFRVDAAIGIHINFLKAFVRIEDIAGVSNSRSLYQSTFYPHYPGYLRFGIETSFFN